MAKQKLAELVERSRRPPASQLNWFDGGGAGSAGSSQLNWFAGSFLSGSGLTEIYCSYCITALHYCKKSIGVV